jgi:hypothetical protein
LSMKPPNTTSALNSDPGSKVKSFPALPITHPLVAKTFKEHITAPLVSPPWVIEPLIAEGDRTITYGQWGSLKSFWILHLALSLGIGVSKLGAFTVPKARKVVYVDEEMSEWVLQQRIQRLALGMKIAPPGVPDPPLYTVSRQGIRLALGPTGVPRLMALCDQIGLGPGDYVFYDSLRRGLVGSEVDQQAVSAFWSSLTHLSKAGINMHFTHHMPKPKGDYQPQSKHLASGSTDILAGADSAFSIRRQGTSITVTQEKNRAAMEAKPFTVTFIFEGDPQTGPIVVDYGETKSIVEAINEANAATNEAKVLAYLKGQPEHKAQTGKICGDLDMPSSSANDALKKLEKKGLVSNPEHGWWQFKAPNSKTPIS